MKDSIVCLTLIVSVFTLGIFLYYEKNVKEYKTDLIVKVTVKGAVRNPGDYYFKKGTAWGSLIEECGGVLERGYLPENFDYKAPIIDNSILYVQSKYILKKIIYEEN